MSKPGLGFDPFATTADPAAYVPRTATEWVLVRLEMALEEGAPALALSGPAGSGKTLLAHVLAHRLATTFQTIYVSYPKLSPDEFFQWTLAALNGRWEQDPEVEIRARIAGDAAAGYPPLLLIVDDAGSIPRDTLRRLTRLQADSEGGLRLLLVRSDDVPLEDLTCEGLPLEDIPLEGGMDPSEMAHYVRARLDRSAADPDCRAKLAGQLDELHEATGGNPARLHAAAAKLICSHAFGGDTEWFVRATYET